MISSVFDKLSDNFIENASWFEAFFDDVNIKDSLREKELQSFLEINLVEISKLISDSIVIGEYISDNIESSLTNIIKNSDTTYGNILFFENTQLHTYTENFVKIIKSTCLAYLNFNKQVKIHLSNPNVEVVFATTKEFSESGPEAYESFTGEIKNEFNVIFQLLGLGTYDHFFDESVSYFKSLINFENAVNSAENSTAYIGAINDKILFLKYKWTIRQITTAKAVKDYYSQKSYIIDNELVSIHQNPQFNSENARLRKWKEYLENHYGYNEHPISYYNDKFHEKLNIEKVNCEDFHFLIKYFKDIKPNYENLKNEVEKFTLREREFHNKFLFYKNLNYALNNQFSLLIDLPTVKDEEVKNLKEKIDALQNKVGYDNFFVDFKYLKYNIKKLNDFIARREALEIKGEMIGMIDDIRELIISCEKKIQWAESHHNLLYQLPYEESLIEYNTKEVKNVYYASSFLLPLSVEQINKEFFDLKIEFQNKYNHFEVLASLNKEFSIIKDLRNKAEDSDKKSIETLTIFTAIISFIVGTVSGFSFVDSFIKALIFILIFSSSLMTFVLLIFLATKGVNKILSYKKIIIGVYTAVIIFLISLFFYKNKFDDKIELEKVRIMKEIGNKKYIDSINTYQDKKIINLENKLKQQVKRPATKK